MTGAADIAVEIGPAWRARLPEAEAIVRRAVTAALEEADGLRGEVSVLLADDATLRALNREHRGKDAPTNVLSFPLCEPGETPGQEGGPLLLGDIAVAFEIASREAEAAGKPLADHLAHLIVHGTMHLIGFDHEAEDEAEAMEALETAALMRIGVPDPYRPAPMRAAARMAAP